VSALLFVLIALNAFSQDSTKPLPARRLTARTFLCDSKTAAGEVSSLKVDVDSGDVMINYGIDWLPLYTTGIYCGLKMKAVNCESAISHNLNAPNKTHNTMTAKYTCKIAGLDIADANGYLEINLSNDGNGYFICGRFAKNDLLLSNCQSTTF
jgi:hypothetical protein